MPKYFCYLISSESHPNSCYIGFTTNPQRRIRQHNGEIKNGAYKTRKKRPWKFEAIIGGFPNKIVSLMFEWQFQHPLKSRFAKSTEKTLVKPRKAVRNLSGHLLTLSSLLSLPLWKQCNLKIYFTNHTTLQAFTVVKSNNCIQNSNSIEVITFDEITQLHKIQKLVSDTSAGTVSSRSNADSMDSLRGRCSICFKRTNVSSIKSSSNSNLIQNTANVSVPSSSSSSSSLKYFQCSKCHVYIHLTCLAMRHNQTSLIPQSGECNSCHTNYCWADIVKGIVSESVDDKQVQSSDDDDDDCDDDEKNNDENSIDLTQDTRHENECNSFDNEYDDDDRSYWSQLSIHNNPVSNSQMNLLSNKENHNSQNIPLHSELQEIYEILSSDDEIDTNE